MNVKYHVACGVALDLYFKTDGMMTLFSVLPDWPIWFNEAKIRWNKEPFDAELVPKWIMDLYFTTHSLGAVYLIWFYVGVWLGFGTSGLCALAYLIHVVTDWFTHTGRFAAKPFYPAPYTIKFGREILK